VIVQEVPATVVEVPQTVDRAPAPQVETKPEPQPNQENGVKRTAKRVGRFLHILKKKSEN
jgi:hypothetical protein